jgi:GMP synthase-like glutamine amidotransferase
LFSPLVKKTAENFNVVLYHADHVVKLPQGFHPLFTSEYCSIQGMAHDQWPIVSLQSHPEMSALLKKDPIEAQDWEHVSFDDLNDHRGPAILARFVDWAAKKNRT